MTRIYINERGFSSHFYEKKKGDTQRLLGDYINWLPRQGVHKQ